MNRVVVTGLGPVSSIGVGRAAFERALFDGRVGVSPIEGFDTTGFPHVVAGEVHDFRPERVLERIEVERWGRSALFAATAARLAVEDAGLVDIDPLRCAVAVGTTCGESTVVERLTADASSAGLDCADAALWARLPAGCLGEAVAAEVGAAGPVVTIATACAASNYALAHVYDWIAHGDADVGLAGGADSVCRWVHAGFFRLGALAPDRCAPFGKDRQGMLTAEGGCALVLESLEHARARNATIYAEILGCSVNCDAAHPVAPDMGSIARCIQAAHAAAGIRPEQVDYIAAHGTGTAMNDSVEANAVRVVFGDAPPPMSSVKSMLGHTMGAASGFGAISTVLAIHSGRLPPTMNVEQVDPELSWVDPVLERARPARVRIAQNHGFAFGGNNAVVVLGAPP